MMEQEAKLFAAELQGNRYIIVTRVFEEWPFHWTIAIRSRDDPRKKGVIRGLINGEILNALLRAGSETAEGEEAH